MHQGKRVVVFTPYGRKRTVSILLPYLQREHDAGVLDEWMLCMNTDPEQEADNQYADELAEQFDWIKQYERPGPDNWVPGMHPDWKLGFAHPKQLNTGRFFWYMQDREAIYLRFDDDVVWVHPQTIRRMVEQETANSDWLATFPLIINNAICSHLLQQNGKIPMEWGQVQAHAVDAVGWSSAEFATKLHRMVLDQLETGDIDAMLIPGFAHALGWRQQFSVSCFAIRGGEYADLGGVIEWPEEEHWLTMHRTGIVQRTNHVIGDALVVHFSFFTQKAQLAKTDLLDRYRALSQKVIAEL